MENIEKISKLNLLHLNSEHYFQSLLEQAYLAGLLSQKELEKIQLECLTLLAKLSEQYNNGDSSSIRVETAEKILTSLLFTIGIHLKTHISPDEAAEALKREPIEQLYQLGKKQLDKMINTSKLLHSQITSKLLDTPNIYYRSTIVDGILGFFKLYRPDFFAQEIHITADYPTYHQVNGLVGIEFIKQYLENIYYENDFLNRFSTENIHHLLCGYHADYQKLLINLFEPVFISALGCILVHADARSLKLSLSDVAYLEEKFKNKTTAAIEQELICAAEKLVKNLSLAEQTWQYLKKSIKKVSRAIELALSMDTLDKVFLIPQYPENKPMLQCSFSSKMDDKLYKKIAEEIMCCQSSVEKIRIIKEKIHSLGDLADILLDTELSETEVSAVLKELSPAEFAAFTKKYLSYTQWEEVDLRAGEVILLHCLRRHISMLPPQQQAWIKETAKVIHIIE
ncbi:hypothetical protein CLNEO_16630 [Anaerotignum neopropionicum]|uniref:Uncharacterized protein n=1 Tax=Anaerotignum neopropionicum TaxID=36847 RepID=A0A136WF59_9FIRM|nr:DUF6179 domain-containing protein [Anaerotignum neopropionicum]KXL53120.1 hypothetical protein CLNEO_16630 [Anaerotignum neopropionicum]